MLEILKDAVNDVDNSYSKEDYDEQYKCVCGNDTFFVVHGSYLTGAMCTKCKKLKVVHDG